MSILRAGTDNPGLCTDVNTNGTVKINATSNDILKTQRVDGITLYDSYELSFNPGDKTSILNIIMLI